MLLNAFRTIVFWFVFLFSIILIPLFLPLCFWLRDKERAYRSAMRLCSILALYFSFTRIEFSGSENLPRESGLIMVANHSSFIDNIILLAKLPDFLFTVHHSGFRLPFIKNIYRGAGCIGVGFRDSQMLVSSAKLINALRNKENVLFYGQFSTRGEIGRFSEIITKLSNEVRVEVLPIVLKNSSRVFRSRKLVFTSMEKIKLHIGQPSFFETNSQIKEQFEKIYKKL